MISVRRAKRSDADFIYDCICDLENKKFSTARFRKFYFENLTSKDNIYLVASDASHPVGFLSCHIQPLLHHCARIGEIQEMYVIPDARSNGIGKILLDSLKQLAQKKKVEQLEVVSNKKRRRTHRFYLAQGFTFTSKKFVLPLR
ncbi:MAG TPA: GNAT family N-acetyltransferase [Chryseosolibacter sp.]